MKTKLKLFHISQNINSDYDTYSDAVVVAIDETGATAIHPSGGECPSVVEEDSYENSDWTIRKNVSIEYLADVPKGSKLKLGQVICASFHAG